MGAVKLWDGWGRHVRRMRTRRRRTGLRRHLRTGACLLGPVDGYEGGGGGGEVGGGMVIRQLVPSFFWGLLPWWVPAAAFRQPMECGAVLPVWWVLPWPLSEEFRDQLEGRGTMPLVGADSALTTEGWALKDGLSMNPDFGPQLGVTILGLGSAPARGWLWWWWWCWCCYCCCCWCSGAFLWRARAADRATHQSPACRLITVQLEQ